jgi:prepilin-type N-terminal cleavage/methylation domain-containing protein
MNKRVTCAFTLIEMLMVIAIIAVLAALIVGIFRVVEQKTEAVRCINSMRQVAQALHAYRADHNGWLPPGYPVDVPAEPQGRSHVVPPGMKSPREYMHVYLAGYLSEVLYATEGSAGVRGDFPYCPGGLGGFGRDAFSKFKQMRINGSYAMNAMLAAVRFDDFPLPTQVTLSNGVTTNTGMPDKTRYDPTRYPFLLEVRAYGATLWTHNMVHQNQALMGGGSWWTGEGGDDPEPGRSHGSGDALNFLFMSGHVETVARNPGASYPFDRDKPWEVKVTNPGGMFSHSGLVPAGIPGRNVGDPIYYMTNEMRSNVFKALYPHLSELSLDGF